MGVRQNCDLLYHDCNAQALLHYVENEDRGRNRCFLVRLVQLKLGPWILLAEQTTHIACQKRIQKRVGENSG